VGEITKIGKCGSTSRGRIEDYSKIREHLSWANRLKVANAGAHIVGEITKTGIYGSTSRGRNN